MGIEWQERGGEGRENEKGHQDGGRGLDREQVLNKENETTKAEPAGTMWEQG